MKCHAISQCSQNTKSIDENDGLSMLTRFLVGSWIWNDKNPCSNSFENYNQHKISINMISCYFAFVQITFWICICIRTKYWQGMLSWDTERRSELSNFVGIAILIHSSANDRNNNKKIQLMKFIIGDEFKSKSVEFKTFESHNCVSS